MIKIVLIVYGHCTFQDLYYINKKPQYMDQPGSSEVTIKRLKDPKSVSDLWLRFADTTSLMGVPFLTSAKK